MSGKLRGLAGYNPTGCACGQTQEPNGGENYWLLAFAAFALAMTGVYIYQAAKQ